MTKSTSLICKNTFYLILIFLSTNLQAQLAVTDTIPDEEMVQALAGEGVFVSNISFDCGDGVGGEAGYGFFSCDTCNLGLEAGIILTSGFIDNATGPNDAGGSTGLLGTSGDPDLDAIPGVLGTNDACALYFDVEVGSDTLLFNYVFGSEEYLEFVGSFNDVFAFYISGPNPAGGTYNMENIAVIPGTTTTVSINNVNDATNPEYYVVNGDGFTTPFSTDPYYIQYDGFTTVLEARAAVVPCETYSLKLVVADDLDSSLDSGVFIEAGSLTTTSINLDFTTDLSEGGFEELGYAVEGCNNPTLVFELDAPAIDTTVINFEVGGTATPGVDYLPILPDSIVLLPGAQTVSIALDAISDTDVENIETLIIAVTGSNLCSEGILDSDTLEIWDNIVAVPEPATVSTCLGNEVSLSVSGGLTCEWTPATYLDDPNSCTPMATPLSSITYMVYAYAGPCVDSTEVNILMDDDFNPQATTEYNICEGQTVELEASGSSFGFYSWAPADFLSCTACPNPVFSGTDTTTYTVSIFDNIGCPFDIDVTINVGGSDLGLSNDTTNICIGETTSFDVTVALADSYTWAPTTGLSCTDCPTPTVTTTESVVYSVTVDAGVCSGVAEKTVLVNNPSADIIESNIDGCYEINETIGVVAQNGFIYAWSPTEGLDDASLAQPTLSLSATTTPINTTYTLTVTDEVGCTATDAVDVRLGTANIDLGDSDMEACSNISTQLGVPPVDGYTYQWAPTQGLSNPSIAQPMLNIDIETSGANVTYTLTVTDEVGCTATDDINFTLNAPIIDLGNTSLQECQSIATQIGVPAQTGLSYQWAPADGLADPTAAQTNLDLSTESTAVNTNYVLTVTDEAGCTATDELTVFLEVPRIITASANLETIIEGGFTQLSVAGVQQGDAVAWSPTTDLSNPNTTEVIARPGENTTYTVTVTTPLGCVSTAEISIIVIEPPKALIPSAFSPNGDGINDELRIVTRDVEELIVFRVFNRWGQIVYENVGDLTQGWDGTYQNENQAVGVYVYYAEYRELGNEQIKVLKGNTSLIR